MRTVSMTVLVGMLLLTAPGIGSARAQKGGSAPVADHPIDRPTNSDPNAGISGGLVDPDRVRSEAAQAAKDAAVDRQKHIVKDTAKLLKLTADLKASVDAMTTDQYSAETIKMVDEIEKAAHDITKRKPQ